MVVIGFFNDANRWQSNFIFRRETTNTLNDYVGCQVILYIKTAVPFIKRTQHFRYAIPFTSSPSKSSGFDVVLII
jgi:hypothetical protein